MPIVPFIERKQPIVVPLNGSGIEIRAQLLDENGNPVDLTNATAVKFTLTWNEVMPPLIVRGVGGTNPSGSATVVSPATNGIVSYVTVAGDLGLPGLNKGQFWVQSTGQQFAFPVQPSLDIRVISTVATP